MARGNRRWGRILAVLALIGIVALVILDRVGVVVAEDTVGKQARAQLASENVATSGNPSVTIDGFPFLTQVVTGHYDKIDIVVPEPTSKGIRFDSLNVTATGVSAPTSTVISGSGRIEADRVVGTAQIGWASFEEMVDLSGLKQYGIDLSELKISGTDAGRITVSAPITLLGETIDAIATGTLSVDHDLLHVTITNVSAKGGEPDPVVASQLQSLAGEMTFETRIPELPYHLVLDNVSTDAGGVNITASADDVTLGS